MVEEIGIKYIKKDNAWLCNKCNYPIYSGKNFKKIFCNCLSHRGQQEIYINYLKKYYDIVDSKYICKKCNHSISSTREQHALKCIGIGTRYNSNGEIDHNLFSKLCDMGCGQESKFFHKNGKAYCCKLGAKCPIKVEKDREKKKGINPFEGKERIHPRGFLGKIPHNKGKTKETSEIVMKQVIAQKKAFAENGHNWVGKKHSAETKQKMSELIKQRYASGWEPVCGRARKYKHSSPIAGNISVDGTWELNFAQILDKVNIKWKRNKKRFDYINLEGGISTYQPDFFIHEWNIFVEVKGYQTDLDICKWKQFNEPLLILKKNHINKIKQWLKEDAEVSMYMLYDLIKDSTREIILTKGDLK